MSSDDVQQVGLTKGQIEAEAGKDIDHELLRVGYEVITRQKQETFMQSWRTHWRGCCWSLFISMALWMEGFDTSVVSACFPFERREGTSYIPSSPRVR